MRTAISLFSIAAFAAVLLPAQERLPMLTPDKMTDAQKKAVADFKASRKADLTPGPFAVLVRVPDLLVPSLQIRLHNQQNSALSPRLTELAIMIASRHYTNNFAWNSHYSDALKAGLSADLIAAIADGRRPSPMSDEEAVIYDFCAELNQHYSVSDPTYARALAKFGESGVVEAASLEGYYAYLALVMNVARTPSPAGARPPLTPFPKSE